MNKELYSQIAQAIRKSDNAVPGFDNPHGFELDKMLLIKGLIGIFKEDNELFDAEKFKEACLMPHSRISVTPLVSKDAELWR